LPPSYPGNGARRLPDGNVGKRLPRGRPRHTTRIPTVLVEEDTLLQLLMIDPLAGRDLWMELATALASGTEFF
jgi:hypothetical protein